MFSETPIVIIIVGINGAGKTTFFQNEIRPRCDFQFINADIWEKENFPSEVGKHSAEAARWAADERVRLLNERQSFVTEVVFFSPRNDIAKRARRLAIP